MWIERQLHHFRVQSSPAFPAKVTRSRLRQERNLRAYPEADLPLKGPLSDPGIGLALVEALKGSKALAPVLERKDALDKLWYYLLQRWMRGMGRSGPRIPLRPPGTISSGSSARRSRRTQEFKPVQVASDMLKVEGLSPSAP
jgi:hypothetical protein